MYLLNLWKKKGW